MQLSDLLNGLMAMPNLPAVLILSHEVTKESFGKKEKINTLKYENNVEYYYIPFLSMGQ